ncbi:MAG: M23 family metallopeptidase [Bacteroidota bacterium]
MRRILILLLISFFIPDSPAQDLPVFDPPMKIPLYLSGNFGEIRPDHPHSGIDIKTQGVTGQKVYAAADGYISRIKVQSGGYGYSLYIDHPGGYTTQYGHLDSYRSDIENYVKNIQYARQSFSVDIYPAPGELKVSRGDFIGYSGNSGSSAGPHLHFEIRTTADQQPTNVLLYHLPVKDATAPKFSNVAIYPVSEESQVAGSRKKLILPVVSDGKTGSLQNNKVIGVSGDFGVGAEVFDFLDGSSNRCGVYSLELQLDGEVIFRSVMDRFTFAESRYINAHADYAEIVDRNMKIHRLYRLPNDRFSIYDHLVNDGIIRLDDSLVHTLSIRASDVAGNRSGIDFQVKNVPARPTVAGINTEDRQLMSWKELNEYNADGIFVRIPARSLYNDITFSCERETREKGYYSDWYSVHRREEALHNPMLLKIKAEGLPEELYQRALIVEKDAKNRIVAIGGEREGAFIAVKVSHFGKFAVAIDTLAPVINPVNITAGKNMQQDHSIRFTISDELSGIDSYRGYIDNQWALFAYDAKNSLLVYKFDPDRLTKGKAHELELYVSDQKGNTSLFHSTFIW